MCQENKIKLKKSSHLLQRWHQITGFWISRFHFLGKDYFLACAQYICMLHAKICLDQLSQEKYDKKNPRKQDKEQREKIKATVIPQQENIRVKLCSKPDIFPEFKVKANNSQRESSGCTGILLLQICLNDCYHWLTFSSIN